MDPLEKVTLDRPKKLTYISSLLSNEEREQLGLLQLKIMDVFVWNHSDMVGIHQKVASHRLNIIPRTRPVK